MIRTQRLHLVPVERQHIDALQLGRNTLAALLAVSVPAEWPHFPHAFAPPRADDPAFLPADVHWYGYFFVDNAQRTLVGNGGFKGPPDDEGIVEIGYEVAASLQNRGYAAEAARGMIDFAFASPTVTAVTAHTLGEINASNRVLQKTGMTRGADVDHPKLGTVWSWKITRQDHAAPTTARLQ
ncbi:MAG: GNAT family N-acetyltransferase [Gemmatimonas sp.]